MGTPKNSLNARSTRMLGFVAWPVRSFVKHFRAEFEYHVTHKNCMPGTSSHRAAGSKGAAA